MEKIRLIQYLHRPNATELGLASTHETYMLISSDVDLSMMFPPAEEISVRDANSLKTYVLKSSNVREFRVNQMGDIYRDYSVRPGDEIIITQLIKGSLSTINLAVKNYNRIIINVNAKGGEILNIERLAPFKIGGNFELKTFDRGQISNLHIGYKGRLPKRKDSPIETDYYDVELNSNKLPNGTYYLSIGNRTTLQMLPKYEYNNINLESCGVEVLTSNQNINKAENNNIENIYSYRPYITAIKSKPFLLLAGISGTGKSRIVRELARACWDDGSEEYKAQKPKNYQLVQVKPNWHDSSELIGYVSRVTGHEKFIAGDFLKFIAKAWENTDIPYFLCLDEMNLAPVEQYFAECLSVIETRRLNDDGTVTTDPILEKSGDDWYRILTGELTSDDDVRNRFLNDGICIPQNLIVVGTVNMDETTFSFSRKVLDRAMTIEMNEVDLHGGLTDRYERIGKLGQAELIGTAVEGVDVYASNKDVCDKVLSYLETVNAVLEGTPFKVAYRTRNEFLLYVVNNLPYSKDEDGKGLPQGYVIARALDEITCMKVLSRIEGDETKVDNGFLDCLSKTIEEGLNAASDDEHPVQSISLAKLKEMKRRLDSGYTSFWS